MDTEQPQWAMELASAATAAGGVPPGPGKLPMPGSVGGPQPFPVYDSSSSSSSDSDDEHGGQGGVAAGE